MERSSGTEGDGSGRARVNEGESLERGLVQAGLEALRQIGGDPLVQILLAQAGSPELADVALTDRVPLEQYLRYRDTALEFLQESLAQTAFETGRILVRRLKHEKESQILALIAQFEYAANKLPLIGQAAVLAAKGSPGTVHVKMRGTDLLLITITECPECRGLHREAPFCYLNQGVITEFAERYLNLRVDTQETKCSAMGNSVCEIEVGLAGTIG